MTWDESLDYLVFENRGWVRRCQKTLLKREKKTVRLHKASESL